jgi:hypothetical protein
MREIKDILLEYLENKENPTLVLKESVEVSDALRYHIENNMSLTNNIFRVYSESYFNLVNEVKSLYEMGFISLNEEDTLMVESNLGEFIILEGEKIYLDAPFEIDGMETLDEAKHRGKNVKLNKPFRTPGGPKKFAVYVKTPKGTVKKVTFGDPGLRVRNKNKGAAKSFRARHKCDQKKDRTTAGYWSCNVGRYAKQLGLSSSNAW